MRKPKHLLFAGVAAAALVVAGAAAGTALRAQDDAVPVQDLPGRTHIHGIAVDPADPQRLFLATHHGFFTVGPDGVAHLVSEEIADFMGFTPDPANPSVLYASGHPAGGGNLGVMTSTDGGKTWTQISPGENGPVDFHAMDVSPANPQVIYGSYGGLQVSRDGGRTWSIAGPLPPKLIDLAASAADEDRVYAATEMGLLVSGDGGKTWEGLLQQGPVTLIQTTPDGALYAFVFGRGLMRAEEPPVSWTTLGSEGIGDGYLLHLAADPANPDRMFAVTGEGQVLASGDGGRSWAPLVGRGAS